MALAIVECWFSWHPERAEVLDFGAR